MARIPTGDCVNISFANMYARAHRTTITKAHHEMNGPFGRSPSVGYIGEHRRSRGYTEPLRSDKFLTLLVLEADVAFERDMSYIYSLWGFTRVPRNRAQSRALASLGHAGFNDVKEFDSRRSGHLLAIRVSAVTTDLTDVSSRRPLQGSST